jgi:hypothetical protein
MSDSSERRSKTRFITILPLVVYDMAGKELDPTATAHDLAVGGFKGELLYDMKEGERFRFSLALADGKPPVRGAAVATWVTKESYACWVGARIVSLSWSDKRRLRAVLAPSGVQWGPIADHLFNAFVWVVIIMALHRVLFQGALRRQAFFELFPSLFALMVMGWALVGLIKKR